MTALLVVLAATGGAVASWVVCTRWHHALRLDRDLHELDSHKNGDALHWLERRLDRVNAEFRYLARLPSHRRLKVIGRLCRRIQQETAA